MTDSSSTGCLDADAVLAYVSSEVSPALRASVEVHLDECQACRELVALVASSGSRAGDDPTARIDDPTPASPPLVPPSVGRYRVDRLLGSGGMAVVMAGWDPTLSRPVAIKFVKASSSDPDSTTRLLREARALAALSHPNVVPVFEAGLVDNGRAAMAQVYVVMELVEGLSLREWMQAEPRPWSEVLEVFEQAAKGLAAAHDAGIIHRDFKPANVMLGDDGRARVMDFGLALTSTDGERTDSRATLASASERRSPSTRLTQTGVVLGTPAYMSPEQDAGEELDARTDQFSFCVALFEALYGQRPFAGTTAHAIALARRQSRIEDVDPGDVPRYIDRAVRRGLAFDPAERWPSMGALIEALRPARRRWPIRLAVAAIAAAALSALLGPNDDPHQRCVRANETLAQTWGPAIEDELRARLVVEEKSGESAAFGYVSRRLGQWATAWQDARSEACGDPNDLDARLTCLEGQRDRVAEIVGVLGASTDVLQRAGSIAALIPDPSQCLEDQLPNPPPTDPSAAEEFRQLQRALARAQAALAAGQHQTALIEARNVAQRASAIDAAHLTAIAQVIIGSALSMAGRFDDARTELETAFFAAQRAQDDHAAHEAAVALISLVGLDLAQPEAAQPWVRHAEAAWHRMGEPPLERGDFLQNVSSVEFRQESYEQALEKVAAAQAIYETLDPDTVGVRLARTHQNMGITLMQLGRLDEAERELAKSRARFEATVGLRHPDAATLISNQGIVAVELGHPDQGIAYFEESLEIRRAVLGNDHPQVAESLGNLAIALDHMGRYQEAIAHLQETVGIFQRIHPGDHPATASSLYNLALSHRNAGDRSAAATEAARARTMWEQTLGPKSPSVAAAIVLQGDLVAAEGDLDQAMTLQQTAYELRREIRGPSHPDTLMSLGKLASVYQAQGRWSEALPLRHEQLESLRKVRGERHPSLAFPLTSIGQCLIELGRPWEAIEPLQEALTLRSNDEMRPDLRGETRLQLALALQHQSEADARAMAELAMADFEGTESDRTDEIRQLRRILGHG